MGTFANNPVLQKELRTQLRARRQTRGARVASMIVAGLVVLLLYYYGGRAILRSPTTARDLFIAMCYIQLLLLVFLCPSLTANAITQEREQQTWNALLLTRLTAEEIVIGKLVARLLPAAMILALFVPLALLAAFVGSVPAGAFFASYLILLMTGAFYAAVGLFCSWAYRRTSVATSSASGAVAFLVVGTFLLYGLWATARMGQSSRLEDFLPLWLNPFVAMMTALDSIGYGSANMSPVPLVANIFLGGVGLVILVYVMVRRLSRGPKELEQ